MNTDKRRSELNQIAEFNEQVLLKPSAFICGKKYLMRPNWHDAGFLQAVVMSEGQCLNCSYELLAFAGVLAQYSAVSLTR